MRRTNLPPTTIDTPVDALLAAATILMGWTQQRRSDYLQTTVAKNPGAVHSCEPYRDLRRLDSLSQATAA